MESNKATIRIKDRTYIRTEKGTNWRIKGGCGNFLSSKMLYFLVIYQLIVPRFKHLVVNQKINKDGFYTPMGDSPTINVMIYTLFGGLLKLKV